MALTGTHNKQACLESLSAKEGKACYGTSVGFSISAANSEGGLERLLNGLSLKKTRVQKRHVGQTQSAN